MILVDTSAWVAFFRNQRSTADRVEGLLDAHAVAVAGPILTELLRGVRSPKERAHLASVLEGCHWLSDPANLWSSAGSLGAQVRKKGATVKTLDLLIATFALAYNVPLLTLDSDFVQIKSAAVSLVLA